jgi:hypothetical protein
VTFPRYPGVSVKKATTTIALDPERLGTSSSGVAADDCLQEQQNGAIARSGNAMLTDRLICLGVLG